MKASCLVENSRPTQLKQGQILVFALEKVLITFYVVLEELLYKKPGTRAGAHLTPAGEGRDRQIPEAHWPASLVEWMLF